MRTSISILAVLPAVLMLGGCYVTPMHGGATVMAGAYVEPAVIYVREPPPAPRVVTHAPPPPVQNAIWVDAHWDWQGRWVWVDGRWETPRAGYVWTAPVCDRAPGGGYHYYPGYWRRQDVQPAPVYVRPGTVRVSVAPSGHVQPGTVHVTPTHPNPGTVHVTPTNPGTVHVTPTNPGTVHVTPTNPGTVHVTPTNPGTVHVTPTQPNPGTVTVTQPGVRPGTTVTVNPGPNPGVRPGTTVTVNPGPNPGTRPGNVVVTPGPGPTTQPGNTVTVTPGPNPGVRPGNTNVTVRPGPGPALQPGQVQANPTLPGSQPGNVVVTPGVRPGVNPINTNRPGQATVTPGQVNPRPNVNVQPGTATPGVVNPSITPGTTTQQPGFVNLTCSVGTSAAPRSGYITVNGQGFSNDATVMIGGVYAPVVARQPSALRAQVPANSSGGQVSVSSGGRTARCGNLSITGG
jgi:hypothetical protein